MAYSARELLARIIKCEAGGEGENGMKAVASVVMNRVNVPYGEYLRVCQGDLRKVIFQKGQFDCATSILRGVPNPQTIWASPPEEIHYQIADWALAGNRLYTTGSALWYFNPFVQTCPTIFPRNGTGTFQVRVGDHCFYNPTELYAQT
ncbi:N-acetylmuramoyl-L-alanine amidase [Clostridium tetanomorphum]|uniref:Cell wall hydrolase n=1 Tax=Clostridium tetanomorphum TaxID=1553 RepID=A0A923J2V3_CLOTT|nr:cell wall hydrolase [Clostridium tetanomorphum]KAJ50126.1 cell wall hydrolase cwlJ [Clostridium tetanomorphum DSM 665]MBC2399205.1 cell wall hydrolase [Clostridium tetanomorphum]MBP1862871.1 N-acetylmuramoyl-L-alanine amidase [Clostridium tetanomorphum]NRS87008.1 N-acetylmuramoyl-L-alanine amidase [Clostridium tetanomorphum]NRZ99207.1 N-acetylmuramoyl-L-alanine amidase [Clostridium tetanomorphum]